MISYEDHSLLLNRDYVGWYLGVYLLGDTWMREGYRFYEMGKVPWAEFVVRSVGLFLDKYSAILIRVRGQISLHTPFNSFSSSILMKISEIRRRVLNVPGGTWTLHGDYIFANDNQNMIAQVRGIGEDRFDTNAEFLLNAKDDILSLLSRVELLEARLRAAGISAE